MTSLLALFHPGHGTTDPDSWRHYLTEPLHVIVLAAAVVSVFAAWRVLRARRGSTQALREDRRRDAP